MTIRRRRKYKVVAHAGFNIREIHAERFMSDVCSHGRRERQSFRTLEEAKLFCEQKRIETKNRGAEAFAIGDRDRLDVTEARRLLGDVPLMEAVHFYLKHHPKGDSLSVRELVRQYLNAPGKRGKKSVDRRPESLNGMRKRLGVFVKTFGDAGLHEVTKRSIEEWLDVNRWQGLNRRHYLAAVNALFDYAVRKEYREDNPASNIERPEIPRTEVEVMPLKSVKNILNTAAEDFPDMLPRLALSFFAGLRPDELARLQWEHISFENGCITIRGDVAKVQGHRRTVELANNLVQWIKPYARDSGPVWPYRSATTLHRKKAMLEKETGVEIPQNAGRHAFASYHLQHHENPNMTAKELGHSSTRLLHDTYKNVLTLEGKTITKRLAAEYWSIVPKRQASRGDNVISLRVA
jgi:integrase